RVARLETVVGGGVRGHDAGGAAGRRDHTDDLTRDTVARRVVRGLGIGAPVVAVLEVVRIRHAGDVGGADGRGVGGAQAGEGVRRVAAACVAGGHVAVGRGVAGIDRRPAGGDDAGDLSAYGGARLRGAALRARRAVV